MAKAPKSNSMEGTLTKKEPNCQTSGQELLGAIPPHSSDVKQLTGIQDTDTQSSGLAW